jgi:hypothetical protein
MGGFGRANTNQSIEYGGAAKHFIRPKSLRKNPAAFTHFRTSRVPPILLAGANCPSPNHPRFVLTKPFGGTNIYAHIALKVPRLPADEVCDDYKTFLPFRVSCPR